MGRKNNKQKPEEELENDVDVDDAGSDVGDGETDSDAGEVNADEPGDDKPEQPEDQPEEEKNAMAQHEKNETVRKMSKDEESHFHLDQLTAFCKGKKEEHLLRDHGIGRVHSGLILEMADSKKRNKLSHFSDGHREVLANNYKKLVHAGKIKE